MDERIQKILAHRGLASRREVEQWIREGRVTVNGQVAVLGDKADPERDTIRVDQRKTRQTAEPRVYFLLHKPRNVVSTLSDPEGRRTIRELLKGVRFRVYPVGRLDFDSEGLMLLTNDGEMTNALLHPSGEVPRVYHVKVQGHPTEETVGMFKRGMRLEDGPTLPADLKPIRRSDSASWWEVTLREGRKRQVRRMFERAGFRVQRLRRMRIGPLTLSGLKPGERRALSGEELERLKTAIARRGTMPGTGHGAVRQEQRKRRRPRGED